MSQKSLFYLKKPSENRNDRDYVTKWPKPEPAWGQRAGNLRKDLDVRISYTFFDDNYSIIENEDSVLSHISIPTKFALMKNYPNPFNPITNIQFTIPVDSFVKLFIYDIHGKTVFKIINSELESGYYNVVWDGNNELGQKVASGIYFYRLQAKSFTSSQKMIFIK